MAAYTTHSEERRAEREACEKRNASRRREFEQRMERKARREGKPDDFYTSRGRAPPEELFTLALCSL